MAIATMTTKGQATIPLEVREFLKLKPGDRLEFQLNPTDGTVLMRAALHVSTLRGFLKSKDMKSYNPSERKIAIRRRAHSR